MARRDSPGPFRILLRAPVWLYRLHLGSVLGGRFLLLRHRGRRTGMMRETVLEVVGRLADRDAYYVAAAWGERAQWYRNVQADARVRCRWGGDGGTRPRACCPARTASVSWRRTHRSTDGQRRCWRVSSGTRRWRRWPRRPRSWNCASRRFDYFRSPIRRRVPFSEIACGWQFLRTPTALTFGHTVDRPVVSVG